MSNQDSLLLSQQIISHIENLIDGNQATKADVQAISSEIDDFYIYIKFSWKFDEKIADEVTNGGDISDYDFGKDKVAFTNQTKKFIEQLKISDQLREENLRYCVKHHNVCELANQQVVYYRFEPFSVTESCDDCRARGRITCVQCNGKGTKGSYKEKRDCSACGGRGTRKCRECSGYGYSVRTRRISGVAKPAWEIIVCDEYGNNHSKEWFERVRKSIEGFFPDLFLDLNINLELMEGSIQYGYPYSRFSYKGKSCWIKQSFKVKNKEYQCYAYSNPPVFYDNPSVFDDLFAEELCYLDEKLGNKKRITNKEGLAFFNRYSWQAALTESLRLISHAHSPDSAVKQACGGFVSSATAVKMGAYLHKIMNVVSPKYARKTWATIEWIGAFFVFMSVLGNTNNLIGSESFFTIAFEAVKVNAVISVVLGSIAATLSTILVKSVRKKIPETYHQKTEHMQRFMKMFGTHFISAAVALVLVFIVKS